MTAAHELPALCTVDDAASALALHSPGHAYRWWTLDAYGFLVAWPKLDAGAARGGDGQ